eukprot:TRINITY_DN7073_c0_g1_i1.p1 TRINITY_DN7073_c0_g1~~TRINITY_DN7073_c0_g1_i1.p1  ORF type:complete len:417 (-),score=73.31 TRINITY_DN7073_c0_g1_i1:214-1464(-)
MCKCCLECLNLCLCEKYDKERKRCFCFLFGGLYPLAMLALMIFYKTGGEPEVQEYQCRIENVGIRTWDSAVRGYATRYCLYKATYAGSDSPVRVDSEFNNLRTVDYIPYDPDDLETCVDAIGCESGCYQTCCKRLDHADSFFFCDSKEDFLSYRDTLVTVGLCIVVPGSLCSLLLVLPWTLRPPAIENSWYLNQVDMLFARIGLNLRETRQTPDDDLSDEESGLPKKKKKKSAKRDSRKKKKLREGDGDSSSDESEDDDNEDCLTQSGHGKGAKQPKASPRQQHMVDTQLPGIPQKSPHGGDLDAKAAAAKYLAPEELAKQQQQQLEIPGNSKQSGQRRTASPRRASSPAPTSSPRQVSASPRGGKQQLEIPDDAKESGQRHAASPRRASSPARTSSPRQVSASPRGGRVKKRVTS